MLDIPADTYLSGVVIEPLETAVVSSIMAVPQQVVTLVDGVDDAILF